MSREVRSAVVFCLLVTIGVVMRIALQHLPNVAPVAALALFAGYYFRSSAVAFAVPISVMLISDRIIGGYEGPVMFAVYAALSLPVAFRWLVRNNVSFGSLGSTIKSAVTVTGCGLVGSLMFFVFTNLAVWGFSDLYSMNVAGLISCFTQALPFFRYTVMGDVCFATAIFGSYALVTQLALSWRPRAVAA